MEWELRYVERDLVDGTLTTRDVTIFRTGVPLFPANTLTTQSSQGRTMRGKVVAYMEKGKRMGQDSYWLHLYTMLSRATALGDLILFNLPPREQFETGPPSYLKDEIVRVQAAAKKTEEKTRKARIRLNWPSRCSV